MRGNRDREALWCIGTCFVAFMIWQLVVWLIDNFPK